MESAVYGHLGTSSLAAYTLTGPIQGLMVGALSGLSAAAGVMVGKKLGRKEYDEAYTESKKIMYAGLFGAVTVSALLILLAGVYTGLYCVDDSVKDLGKTLLIVFALYAPVKVENMILGGGIIRSGGNTKIIMIIDIVGTWCIGIPLCLLAAYVFKWGIVGVYTLLTTEELFRLAVSLIVFKRRKWMLKKHCKPNNPTVFSAFLIFPNCGLFLSAPVSSSPPAALHPQISYKYLPASLAAHVFPAAQFFLCQQPQSGLHV